MFKVGSFEYEYKTANQTITKEMCQFHITLADEETDIEEMDTDIRPIVKDGFFIDEQEFTGYDLQIIVKNIIEGQVVIEVQLAKER